MKSQKGAALIVVLSLLTISLMVGLSSMQSSQIDERLAGNYRAVAQAQMGAEEAASFAFGELLTGNKGKGDFLLTDLGFDELSNISSSGFGKDGNFGGKGSLSGGCSSVDCYFRYVKLVGGGYYVLALGSAGGAVSE